MNNNFSYVDYIAILISVIFFIESIIRLNFVSNIKNFFATLSSSIKRLRSKSISDHWKERASTMYARRLIFLTLYLIFLMLFSSIPFLGYLMYSLLQVDWNASIFSDFYMYLYLALFSLLYTFFRRFFYA